MKDKNDPQNTNALNREFRNILETNLRSRIDKAFAAFGDAILSQKMEVRDALNTEYEIRTILLKSTISLLLPSILSNVIPLSDVLSNLFSDESGAINPSGKKLCDAIQSLKRREVENQYINTILKGSLEISNAKETKCRVLRKKEEYDDLLDSIKDAFHFQLQEISESLIKMSDKQLGILYLVFDAKHANSKTYKEAIGKLLNMYKNEIKPIGKSSKRLSYTSWQKRVVLIGDRLALVKINLNAENSYPEQPEPPPKKLKRDHGYVTQKNLNLTMLPFDYFHIKKRMGMYKNISGESKTAKLMRSANIYIKAANEQIRIINRLMRSKRPREHYYGQYEETEPKTTSEFKLLRNIDSSWNRNIVQENEMIMGANKSISLANDAIERVELEILRAKYEEDYRVWEKGRREHKVGKFERWISSEMRQMAEEKASDKKIEIKTLLASQIKGLPDNKWTPG